MTTVKYDKTTKIQLDALISTLGDKKSVDALIKQIFDEAALLKQLAEKKQRKGFLFSLGSKQKKLLAKSEELNKLAFEIFSIHAEANNLKTYWYSHNPFDMSNQIVSGKVIIAKEQDPNVSGKIISAADRRNTAQFTEDVEKNQKAKLDDFNKRFSQLAERMNQLNIKAEKAGLKQSLNSQLKTMIKP